MSGDSAITGVADTALWMAAVRAAEAERPDAIFQDRLASILAGERGFRIARGFPQTSQVSWGVVVRTAAIDRLIQAALPTVDTVVNLGAGMDTRPYRMMLPPSLRWLELDLPDVLATKNSALAGRTPNCRVERIAVDLLDRTRRNALLAAAAAPSRGVLAIAEGVIPYFCNDDAAALAGDLAALAVCRRWILDFDNAGVRATPRRWAKRLQAAPILFTVPDWFRFFHDCGWQAGTTITSAEESERVQRPYPAAFPAALLLHLLPAEIRRKLLSVSGAVMLERAPSSMPAPAQGLKRESPTGGDLPSIARKSTVECRTTARAPASPSTRPAPIRR